jgi:glucose/arabinose dehydrogenase
MLRKGKEMSQEKKQPRKVKKGNRFLLLLLIVFLYSLPVMSQVSVIEAFPALEFTSPVDLQQPNDGTNRLFVVEQEGIIRVFENSSSVSEHKVFLDIRDRVKISGEMGLLGLAFHPNYAQNGYFYVNYTTDRPNNRSIISRFHVSSDPDAADEDSEVRLLRLDQPDRNHNGGQISFGPDGFLYIAFGDGGGAGDPRNNGQNKRNLFGTILRIDVDREEGNNKYANPNGNPYKGNGSGFREEIFAHGFRNPWRFSFDKLTGTMWAADVGQSDYEEINIVEAGGNYGWSIKEGKHCFKPSSNCEIPGLTDPIFEYSHGQNTGYSITGGFVYRGTTVPELYGKYVYGDYVSKNIWALEYDFVNPPVNEFITEAEGNIVSFGTDQNDELYILTFSSDAGRIFKFASPTNTGDPGIEVKDYKLSEVYPNPFNPSTTFSFTVPEESNVKIDVLSVTGELVSTIKDEVHQSGEFRLNWSADGLASGIYFIRMTAVSTSGIKSYNNTIKAVLLR